MRSRYGDISLACDARWEAAWLQALLPRVALPGWRFPFSASGADHVHNGESVSQCYSIQRNTYLRDILGGSQIQDIAMHNAGTVTSHWMFHLGRRVNTALDPCCRTAEHNRKIVYNPTLFRTARDSPGLRQHAPHPPARPAGCLILLFLLSRSCPHLVITPKWQPGGWCVLSQGLA